MRVLSFAVGLPHCTGIMANTDRAVCKQHLQQTEKQLAWFMHIREDGVCECLPPYTNCTMLLSYEYNCSVNSEIYMKYLLLFTDFVSLSVSVIEGDLKMWIWI